MNILLDTSPLGNQHGGRGIGTYTRELLRSLRELLATEGIGTVTATHEHPEQKKWNYQDFDIVHFPFFDLFFSTLPVVKQVPTVVTVHDVTPLVLDDLYPVGIRGKLKFFRQKWALSKVQAVITDSQNSQKDIVKYLNIPRHKVYVSPLAASPDLQPQSEYFVQKHTAPLNLPETYVLYIGDINQNKNIVTLLLALTQVDPEIHLCVVSQNFRNTNIPEGKTIAETIAANNLRDRVHVLSVPVGEHDLLAAVMTKAKCVVQPSLYEGFGLPVLEALQVGAIVVSSNTSSLPEVGGESVFFVEPTIAGLASGIESAVRLRGEDRLTRREAGIQHAHNFSWQKTAKLTYQVYEEVLQEAQRTQHEKQKEL